MKNLILIFSLFISFSFAPVSAEEPQVEYTFSEAELAQMLAPIALYPDSLLTHILIASTYPIEIVEAQRWTVLNKDLSTDLIAQDIEDKDWDPSVKALVPFPDLLKRLSEDLTWTRKLGDAFLQDEAMVLQSIQQLRSQAEQAGNLNKMDKMEVSREDNNIIIQPTEKEIVYVPYYDSREIYGVWHWSLFPPIYWGHHNSRYGYQSHYSPFSWHSGVHISFNYFFSAFHWHNRHIVVVDHRNSRHYRQRRHIVSGQYAKHWDHKPHHRRGVAYRNDHVKKRYNSDRPSFNQTRVHRNNEKKFNSQPNKHTEKERFISNKHLRTGQPVKVTKHEQLKRKMQSNKHQENESKQLNNMGRAKEKNYRIDKKDYKINQNKGAIPQGKQKEWQTDRPKNKQATNKEPTYAEPVYKEKSYKEPVYKESSDRKSSRKNSAKNKRSKEGDNHRSGKNNDRSNHLSSNNKAKHNR